MSGAQNMAFDEAFLRAMQKGDAPLLRFYKWHPSCLSIGRFQKATQIGGVCGEASGLDWVRRPTGGRAVWHQFEITYSVVIRGEFFPTDACSVVETYRQISEGFLRGLKFLGIEAEIARDSKTETSSTRPSSTRSRAESSPNCFQSATRADFVVDGRKILGAAQCRKNGAILQHGSLLLDVDASLWAQKVGGSMQNVVTLKSLSVEAPREQIVAALCAGIENHWKISLQKSAPTKQETRMANFLLNTKYSRENWNRNGIDAVESLSKTSAI